jgi:hypothetical protein
MIRERLGDEVQYKAQPQFYLAVTSVPVVTCCGCCARMRNSGCEGGRGSFKQQESAAVRQECLVTPRFEQIRSAACKCVAEVFSAGSSRGRLTGGRMEREDRQTQEQVVYLG